MGFYWGLLIGIFVGATVGFFTMCLLTIGRDYDEIAPRNKRCSNLHLVDAVPKGTPQAPGPDTTRQDSNT